MSDETLDLLKRLDTKVSALLAILIDGYLRDTGLAQPRPRSIDRMLVDVGLTGSEVARLLGKSPQAVSQVLARDGKSSNSRAKPTEPKRTSKGRPSPLDAEGKSSVDERA